MNAPLPPLTPLPPPTGVERLPVMNVHDYDDTQRAFETAMKAGPRGGVRGPFAALIRSPIFADHTQRLGAFLRHESAVPPRLRELAILVTVRFWQQSYEWQAHAAAALKAGIEPATIRALINASGLDHAPEDEKLIYAFCSALNCTHFVEDEVYDRAVLLLGEPGVVELIGLCGYFTLISMVLNVARTPIVGEAFAMPEF